MIKATYRRVYLGFGSRGVRVHHGGQECSERKTWHWDQEAESSHPQLLSRERKLGAGKGHIISKLTLSDELVPARLNYLNLPKQLYQHGTER